MRIPRAIVLATMVVAAISLVPEAKAQGVDPYCSGGFPYPGWDGYYSSPYASGRIPTPPYFALHPPVYYSFPVPRSYGYSPYAYPGTMQTPQIEIESPVIIENPHTSDKKVKRDERQKTASTQREILNPYVSLNRQGRASLAAVKEVKE